MIDGVAAAATRILGVEASTSSDRATRVHEPTAPTRTRDRVAHRDVDPVDDTVKAG